MLLNILTNKVDRKSLILGGVTLLLTAIHAHPLSVFGEPRPSYFLDIAEAFVLSTMLHCGLWFCTLKIIRVKLRYLIAPLVFLSGITFLTMYGDAEEYVGRIVGVPFIATIFMFHLWLVYDLLRGRETW